MISFIIMDLDNPAEQLYVYGEEILNWAQKESEVLLLVQDKKEFTHNKGLNIRMINLPDNAGRLGSWYIGAMAAQGEYLCLLHGDTELTGEALAVMQAKLMENPRIGAVGPRLDNAYVWTYYKKDFDLLDGLQHFPEVKGGFKNAVLFLEDSCILLQRDILLRALESIRDKQYNATCFASILLSWGISGQGKFLSIADTEVKHAISGREDSVELYFENEKKFSEEYQTNWQYSSSIRRELLVMMKPVQPEISVLDVGCAYGGNLMLIGSYLPKAKLYGVDIDETSVQAAKAYGDVMCADVEKLEKNEWRDKFDYILIGDCLEHLRDPWQALKKIAGYLKPNGEVIISLPNINHISILRGLLGGRFQYEPAGILDRTHLRFFTKDSIRELLEAAELDFLTGNIRIAYLSKEDEDLYEFLKAHNWGSGHFDEFMAYQYVLKAKRSLITSIIILNRNLLSYTQQLIESIRQYTEAGSYEIIVVDNGSTDGSVEWLRRQADVKLIANKENVGFPRGCNQGLKIAQGQEIMFLNNDTVVTANWLTNLRQALYSTPNVGAVGPVTNYSSNMQAIDVPYSNENTVSSMDKMQKFAAWFNKSNPQKWHKWMMLVGFCMLFKREVYEKIGDLDEAFSPGNYEDDDYSLRIRKAGYELLLCKDIFIHHFGSKTFNKMDDDHRTVYSRYILKNRAYFCEKWHLNDELYHRYRTFLLDLEFADESVRIIEYEAGCTIDLYILGMLCPKGEITGTTSNMADLDMGCSYPLVYVPDLQSFTSVLEGEYQLIILSKDIAGYSDEAGLLREIEKHLSPGGWLITVKDGNLLRMQKE